VAFGSHDSELRSFADSSGRPAFRVFVNSFLYWPDHRSHYCDETFALVLAAPGKSGFVPPSHLHDDVVVVVLNVVKEVLLNLSDWAGHDTLAIWAAFYEAEQEPSIERRHIASEPRNAGEASLLGKAMKIQNGLCSELASLDRMMSGYHTEVRESGVEAIIPRLGLQAELGSALGLRKLKDQHKPFLRHAVRNRSLTGLVRATHNALAAHQRLAEAVADSNIEGRNWLTGSFLQNLHSIILQALPDEENRGLFRQEEVWVISPGRCRGGLITVPDLALAEAVGTFCSSYDAALWSGIHPIIRAGLAHLSFLRLKPFDEGIEQIASLLLHGFFMEAGLAPLPWEYLIYWKGNSYCDAFMLAQRTGDEAGFLRYLIAAAEDAMSIGRYFVDELGIECNLIWGDLVAREVSNPLANKIGEFTGSMLLGPDPQAARRTVHAMELSFRVGSSDRFDTVDASSLGYTLAGYESTEIWSNREARKLMRAPMPGLLAQ
jgi:hypothetical protein